MDELDDSMKWMSELHGAPSQNWVFVSSFAAEDEDSTCVLRTLGGSQRRVQSTWLGIDTSLRELSLFHLWLLSPPRPHRVPASSLPSDSLPLLPWFTQSCPICFSEKLSSSPTPHFSDETPVIQKPPAPGFPEFRDGTGTQAPVSWLGISPPCPYFPLAPSVFSPPTTNQHVPSRVSQPFWELGMVTVRNPSTHHQSIKMCPRQIKSVYNFMKIGLPWQSTESYILENLNTY